MSMSANTATPNQVPDAAVLIERARALAPVLRARSADAEPLKQCPRETIDDMMAAGLHRIVQPKRYGGYGMDWDVLCESAMELGQGCGGQAWAVTVLCDHPCIAGMFSKQAQDDIWADDPDILVSTSYAPRGTVRTVDGGYVLNGKWMFSSGIVHSGWTILGGFVETGDGSRQHHFFLVPASDRKILDDWNVMGMASSGSQSFLLEDVFVPEHRALDASSVIAGDPPGASVNDEPLHRMPIIGFTGTVLVSVIVGVAIGMVRDFETMVKQASKAVPVRAGLDELLLRAAEADAEMQCAKLLVLHSARENMAKLRAGHRLDEGDAARTARNSAYVARLAKQAATRLFEVTGGGGLSLSSHFQRAFRDVYGGAAHITLSWGQCADRYGNYLVGRQTNMRF